MGKIMSSNLKIDSQILDIDKLIYNSIEIIDKNERGFISQIILSNLRNFVEHIMLKVYSNGNDINNSYENICEARNFVRKRGDLKLLWRFHDFLEIVASHYTLDEENSERLMLKYYEHLVRIKKFLKLNYSIDVLKNLWKFPLNADKNLEEYHNKIAIKLNNVSLIDLNSSYNDRYYIQKVKPFFIDEDIYYEVTFTPSTGNSSKFERNIAFTTHEISSFYSVKLFIVNESIEILGKTMPIFLITNWETSIRPCELNNFSSILGPKLNINRNHIEYQNMMRYLTVTGLNLVEITNFDDDLFQIIKEKIVDKSNNGSFFDYLEESRRLIINRKPGYNILKYLLYHLNNAIIRNQLDVSNSKLTNLNLSNKCIPFEQMPFNSSLINHNPRLIDLFNCIDSKDREHELLARKIRNKCESDGQLYTELKEVSNFGNVSDLILKHNNTLWFGHISRQLKIFKDNIYIKEYEDDTIFIIEKLIQLSKLGVDNYHNYTSSWINSKVHIIDCEEKKKSLIQMFRNSTVTLIYGSAGTGKSYLINHVSHLFADKSKLYLANTNPAVDNLKRKITASNGRFSTIAKFLNKQNKNNIYDILFIDECSTVSNKEMREILEKATFKLLVLVGDVYQIESIRFGNWFNIAQSFIPETSVFELTYPHRTKNTDLLELWKRVRDIDDSILELIAKKKYSTNLNESILDCTEDDEIILCLNYDGLYGINNINRFLQESNSNLSYYWGIQLFKVNDPILFNETERFAPLIYNNMKGKIIKIDILKDKIQFDIELDKVIIGIDTFEYDFKLVGNSKNGNSIIRFIVNKNGSTDEDETTSSSSIIPFQVAYAVSIHKAQGLEYNSVKLVITDEVDELITHNIFYTAITRTKNKLKIYWSPEVEKRILSSIKPKNNNKDVALLKISIK